MKETLKAIITLVIAFIIISIQGIDFKRADYMYVNVDNITAYRLLQPLEIFDKVQIDFSK